MLYLVFMALAVAYNFKKFRREREAFLHSLVEATHSSHREMILSHHFYIFIFESFLALIVAHLVTPKASSMGILELGFLYLGLLFLGFYFYQIFVRYLEKQTGLELFASFKTHLIKELRVNFAVIMLPILVYSIINRTFQDGVYEEWGNLWFLGLLFNIIFVSVLTIVCSVVIMLRIIPNREISEPEYLEIINHRLEQIGQPNMRVRWIETDIKNAFVFGIKLLRFSNQTMFLGRSLRKTLSKEEFDAVIAHELAHVANRHIHKRVLDLMKNFISVILGIAFIMLVVLGSSFLYWGEDAYLHSVSTSVWCAGLCMAWIVLNYVLLFDTIRSHEYEADGYAVIELGAKFSALKSALENLTAPDELPEYLKKLKRNKSEKGLVAGWISKTFATHPDLASRIQLLEYKISHGLPFNYYVSSSQRMRKWLGYMMNWKVSAPLAGFMVFSVIWATWTFKTGQDHIAFINHATPEEIRANQEIARKINSRPLLIGQSLMYFIVNKKDESLIDYYVDHGADKGKTLIYISQLKDFSLFKRYYNRYQSYLSDDEFFLVLRKTAQTNFVDGYRLLVNARQFEDLSPAYKENVSRIHQGKTQGQDRLPASVKE